jgi:hypothetical protein
LTAAAEVSDLGCNGTAAAEVSDLSYNGRPSMPTFVYIDYGPSPDIATELKYSLATLLYEYFDREPDVVVYTDKPYVYTALHAKVRVRAFGDDLAAWTRQQLFGHRAKICVLIDALSFRDDYCVLLDSDTFIRRGFAEAITRAMDSGGVAMDEFERADPFPPAAGFLAELPRLGRYAYDGAAARMYNSGLVGVAGKHLPLLEDALALVDALIDADFRSHILEQLALSEAFRLNHELIAEMQPWFEHYFRRSQKLYMRPRIAQRWAREGTWKPLKPFLEPSKLRVRSARICDKLLLRLSA